MKGEKSHRARITKLMYKSTIDNLLSSLETQKERIFRAKEPSWKIRPTHDAYYYMIIANKLYREVDRNKRDSRVGRLNGKYRALFIKIKIRQDFEHSERINSDELLRGRGRLPSGYKPTGPIIEVTNVYLGRKNFIVSGDKKWDLNKDHALLAKAMAELVNIYPFNLESNQKVSLVKIYKRLIKAIKYFYKVRLS